MPFEEGEIPDVIFMVCTIRLQEEYQRHENHEQQAQFEEVTMDAIVRGIPLHMNRPFYKDLHCLAHPSQVVNA